MCLELFQSSLTALGWGVSKQNKHDVQVSLKDASGGKALIYVAE